MNDTNEAKFKVCSKGCYDNWERNGGCSAGAAAMNFLFTSKLHQISSLLGDGDLARVAQVSKTLNIPATRGQLGPWFEKTAIHYDARRGEVNISRDEMIQMALAAYRAATGLKQSGLPVILYRVFDKWRLTSREESSQTVAGAAHNDKNYWPVERTAAWIQGALRARIPFLVLTDPRSADALVGGKDKYSDAVYVRELFQIIQTRYIIRLATPREKPAGMRGSGVKIFVLAPPARDGGPLPLIPRMSNHMDYHHTWDSSQTTLTVDDQDVDTMAAFIVKTFTEAGKALGM